MPFAVMHACVHILACQSTCISQCMDSSNRLPRHMHMHRHVWNGWLSTSGRVWCRLAELVNCWPPSSISAAAAAAASSPQQHPPPQQQPQQHPPPPQQQPQPQQQQQRGPHLPAGAYGTVASDAVMATGNGAGAVVSQERALWHFSCACRANQLALLPFVAPFHTDLSLASCRACVNGCLRQWLLTLAFACHAGAQRAHQPPAPHRAATQQPSMQPGPQDHAQQLSGLTIMHTCLPGVLDAETSRHSPY